MTNLEVVHLTVAHYLKYNFRPVELEGEKKVKYMIENALRISLGKSFDHTEYCLWLSDNAPHYGVIIKDYATLKSMRAQKRRGKWKHSELSSQIQIKVKSLDIGTKVLILLNASEFSTKKLKTIARSWPSNKPLIFIG